MFEVNVFTTYINTLPVCDLGYSNKKKDIYFLTKSFLNGFLDRDRPK